MKKLFLICLIFSTALTYAGVNLKNGNFYISYTDIIATAGKSEIIIQRTYNSLSTYSGIFGNGWSSTYETKIAVTGSGEVTVYENGGGQESHFAAAIKEWIAADIEAIIAAEKDLSKEEKDKLRTTLATDRFLRRDYLQKLKVQSLPPVNAIIPSTSTAGVYLKRVSSGFQRHSPGKIEEFNLDGQLITVLMNDDIQRITYKDRKIVKIAAKSGAQLHFKYSDSGALSSIESSSSDQAQYAFNKGELVAATDMLGGSYRYSYDQYSNLIRVVKEGVPPIEIEYNEKTGAVKQLKDRNGETKAYTFGANKSRPELEYWTEMYEVDGNEKTLSMRLEYNNERDEYGNVYLSRYYRKEGSTEEEKTYNAQALPTMIRSGKLITRFKYDTNGLLIEKTDYHGTVTKIEYIPQQKKISKVTIGQDVFEYEYNKKGLLAKATTSAGQTLILDYDFKRQISKMAVIKIGSKTAISFRYNAAGQPVEFSLSPSKKLNINYDLSGNKKVSTTLSTNEAIQLLGAIDALSEITSPAGVQLKI